MMRVTTAFAQKLLEETNNNYDDAIQRAFLQAYNRPPLPRELEIGKKAIAAEGEPKEGLRLFVQAMFAANSFLYSY